MALWMSFGDGLWGMVLGDGFKRLCDGLWRLRVGFSGCLPVRRQRELLEKMLRFGGGVWLPRCG